MQMLNMVMTRDSKYWEIAESEENAGTCLKGARFSTPSEEMLETKAIGRGTMPLIIIAY